MQYNQFCANGISNCGSYLPYNPQIIGEGDVTSVMTPNGTMQYLFTPIAQWWPYAYNPNPHNNNPYLNANTGAWFVRSIPNAFQTPVHCQPFPRSSTVQHSIPCYNSESNVDISGPGFQLKFHNDDWTSTTDLHYFYPRLRQYDMFPTTLPYQRGSAAIQVEMPVMNHSIYHREVFCDKPCHCSSNCQEHQPNVEKVEFAGDEAESTMSIDETRPKHEENCCQTVSKSKKMHISSTGDTKSKKDHLCECKKPPESCSDKSVTTYSDQASGCTMEVGRETQTNCAKPNACANATPIQRVQSVMLNQSKTSPPKKPGKRRIKSRDKTVNESDCSSSCSCDSESD